MATTSWNDTDQRRKTMSESERMKKANNIRQIEYKEMAQHEPSEHAKRHMQHKPYAVAVMIRVEGEQIEHLSTIEYLQKKGIGK